MILNWSLVQQKKTEKSKIQGWTSFLDALSHPVRRRSCLTLPSLGSGLLFVCLSRRSPGLNRVLSFWAALWTWGVWWTCWGSTRTPNPVETIWYPMWWRWETRLGDCTGTWESTKGIWARGAPGFRVQKAHSLHDSIRHVPVHSDAFLPTWSSSPISTADAPCAGGGPKVCCSKSRWRGHLQQLLERLCNANGSGVNFCSKQCWVVVVLFSL